MAKEKNHKGKLSHQGGNSRPLKDKVYYDKKAKEWYLIRDEK
jgi:hypothetical protein|tara:strand:- start:452 stop:577 length:126 start_codon:yes stop_codon:yes gene_type:complete